MSELFSCVNISPIDKNIKAPFSPQCNSLYSNCQCIENELNFNSFNLNETGKSNKLTKSSKTASSINKGIIFSDSDYKTSLSFIAKQETKSIHQRPYNYSPSMNLYNYYFGDIKSKYGSYESVSLQMKIEDSQQFLDVKNNEISKTQEVIKPLREIANSFNWICSLCFQENSKSEHCKVCNNLKYLDDNSKPLFFNSENLSLRKKRTFDKPNKNKSNQGAVKGDWLCAACFNVNFSFRIKCNRCGIARYAGETEKNNVNPVDVYQNFNNFNQRNNVPERPQKEFI